MACPSVDYVRMVLVPMLEKMRVPSDGIVLDITRRGFYPQVRTLKTSNILTDDMHAYMLLLQKGWR